MANNCYFIAKAIGSKDAVEEFARVLAAEGEFSDDYLGRVYDFEAESAVKTHAENVWTIEGQGDCECSVLISMLADELDCDSTRSLESETARLGIAVEIYSSEADTGFQEHVLVVNGQVLENECVDYQEYSVEELEYDGVLEEVAESLGVTPGHMRENTNHDGEYVVGGFGESFGSFGGIAAIERDYASLRNYELAKHVLAEDVERAVSPNRGSLLEGAIKEARATSEAIADKDHEQKRTQGMEDPER